MNRIERTSEYLANQRTKQLRELLRRDFGAGRYRLTSDGDVHVFGVMPDSIRVGWYLAGSRRAVEAGYEL